MATKGWVSYCKPGRVARTDKPGARSERSTHPRLFRRSRTSDAFSVFLRTHIEEGPIDVPLWLCPNCPDARSAWQIHWESALGDRWLCLVCDECRALLDIQIDDGESRSRIIRLRRWPPLRDSPGSVGED